MRPTGDGTGDGLPTSLTLLQQDGLMTTTMAIIVIPIILLLFVTAFFIRRYVRCPTNKVLVISGGGDAGPGGHRFVKSGGALVLPLLQEHDFLSLEPHALDVNVSPALTSEREVRADVDTTWRVAIATDDASLETAATRLLGLDADRVRDQARGLIVGGVRAAVAALTLENITDDRGRFRDALASRVDDELNKIGMTVLQADVVDVRGTGPTAP